MGLCDANTQKRCRLGKRRKRNLKVWILAQKSNEDYIKERTIRMRMGRKGGVEAEVDMALVRY